MSLFNLARKKRSLAQLQPAEPDIQPFVPTQPGPAQVQQPQPVQPSRPTIDYKAMEQFIRTRLNGGTGDPDPSWTSTDEITDPDGNLIVPMSIFMLMSQRLATQSGMSQGEAEQFAQSLMQGETVEPEISADSETKAALEQSLQMPTVRMFSELLAPLFQDRLSRNMRGGAGGDAGEDLSNATVFAFGLTRGDKIPNDLTFFGEHGWEYLPAPIQQEVLEQLNLDQAPGRGRPRAKFATNVGIALQELGLADVMRDRLMNLMQLAGGDQMAKQQVIAENPDFTDIDVNDLTESLYNRFMGQYMYESKMRSLRRGGGKEVQVAREGRDGNVVNVTEDAEAPNESPGTVAPIDEVPQGDDIMSTIQRQFIQLADNVEALGDDVSMYLTHLPRTLTEGVGVGDPNEDWPEGVPSYAKSPNTERLSVGVQAYTHALARQLRQLGDTSNPDSRAKTTQMASAAYKDILLKANEKRAAEGLAPLKSIRDLFKEYGYGGNVQGFLGQNSLEPVLGDDQENFGAMLDHSEYGDDAMRFSTYGLPDNFRVDTFTGLASQGRMNMVPAQVFQDIINDITKSVNNNMDKPEDGADMPEAGMSRRERASQKMFDKPSQMAAMTQNILPFLLLPEVQEKYDLPTRRAFTDLIPSRGFTRTGKGSNAGALYAPLYFAARGELHNMPVAMQKSLGGSRHHMAQMQWEETMKLLKKYQDVARMNLAMPAVRKNWEQMQRAIHKFESIRARLYQFKVASSDIRILDQLIFEAKAKAKKLELMSARHVARLMRR